MTYATALGLTLACGAIGLACIAKDREVRDLTFLEIVRVTRNVELDGIFGKNTVEDAAELQYRVERRDEQRSGWFVLVKSWVRGGKRDCRYGVLDHSYTSM
ncbi:hypothetical protein F5146DRAFT_381653 [Armillaria mellea]|nr:hypothetical protein F5146DRAFT_381653 [Armillaria mellea]